MAMCLIVPTRGRRTVGLARDGQLPNEAGGEQQLLQLVLLDLRCHTV